jgi:hypothetical protein
LVSQAGLNVAPTGTYSASFDNLFLAGGSGDYSWSFVGTAVPEPSAFGVLGVSLIGLLARRRKKS